MIFVSLCTDLHNFSKSLLGLKSFSAKDSISCPLYKGFPYAANPIVFPDSFTLNPNDKLVASNRKPNDVLIGDLYKHFNLVSSPNQILNASSSPHPSITTTSASLNLDTLYAEAA